MCLFGVWNLGKAKLLWSEISRSHMCYLWSENWSRPDYLGYDISTMSLPKLFLSTKLVLKLDRWLFGIFEKVGLIIWRSEKLLDINIPVPKVKKPPPPPVFQMRSESLGYQYGNTSYESHTVYSIKKRSVSGSRQSSLKINALFKEKRKQQQENMVTYRYWRARLCQNIFSDKQVSWLFIKPLKHK